MNYLELCQELRSECGIQGDGPSSVVGQTGIMAKLVRWTRQAYIDIQSRPFPWDWLQQEIEFPLTAGLGEYDLLSGASWARPDVSSFKNTNSWLWPVATPAAKTKVKVLTHDEFVRDVPDRTAVGVPSSVSIAPWRAVRFNRVPDRDCTYRVECRLTPELLSANDHVPAMPEQHHRVIVLFAAKYYARHDADTTLSAGLNEELRTAWTALIRECTPAIEWKASRGEDPI